MRSAVFDLETTNLSANFGRLLIGSIKEVQPDGKGKMVTFRADDKRFRRKDIIDDGALAVAIRDELERFDIIIGQNSKLFDAKFLNARLLKAEERPLRQIFHIDLMWITRSNLRVSSKLENIGKQFGLPTPKLSVSWEDWARAHAGDRKALDVLVERCETDVELTEQAFWKLKPLIKSIPRV